MSRALRHLAALVLFAFAASTAACAASATGPRPSVTMAQCDVNNSNTCR